MKTPLTDAASGMPGDPHWVVAEKLFVCSQQLETQNLALVAEYERVSAENTRLREALHEIAAFDDVGGCEALKNCGNYGMFDEPVSVQIARAALAVTPSC